LSATLHEQLKALLGPVGFVPEPDLLDRHATDSSKYTVVQPIAMVRPIDIAQHARTQYVVQLSRRSAALCRNC
jgi:hypothetical protein